MASDDRTNGSRGQRFRKTWLEWLETGQLPKAVQALVAFFLFLLGIGFQLLLPEGIKEILGDRRPYIWLIIILYILSAIVLSIVASVWIGSLNSVLRRVTSENQSTRAEVERGQEAILESVKSMVGLAAEYIDDKDRAYQRSRELIAMAEKRLIFVDWWVDVHQYDTAQARQDYYQAITDRIKRHLDQSREGRRGDFTHMRIVQMDASTELSDVSSILKNDKVYWEHIRTCVELEDRPSVTSVYIAEPYTRTHFAIIDDVFVQPILTTSEKGLHRYGAILYTDRHGELIRRYEQLISDLDKQRLKKEHIVTNKPSG